MKKIWCPGQNSGLCLAKCLCSDDCPCN